MPTYTVFYALKRSVKPGALLVLFLFFSCHLFAQGIYEIKYRFYEKDQQGKSALGREYQSLVFYYDESSTNNIMRTRYYDATDGWVVVEQKIKTWQTTISNKNYWVLGGADAKFVTRVSQGTQYYPDKVVLSKSPYQSYYSPDFVYDDNKNTGRITSFKVLNKDDVTNTFLSPFAWQWPEQTKTNDYTYTGLNQSTLHLILVTNSNDNSLGSGFEANHRKVKSLFSDAAGSCGIGLDVVEVKGTNFSKANVLNAVQNVSAGPNDIIVFYYSGHGFRFSNQTSDWPQMDLRQGVYQDPRNYTLNLASDVYTPLANKNSRLLLVIGECCNVDIGIGTPSRSDPVVMAPGGNVMNSNIVRSLFSKRGKAIIATSKPKEASWYYIGYGGYFCNSFINNFMQSVGFTSSGNVSWEKIFTEAMNNTTRLAQQDADPSYQDPIYHFELN